MTHALERLLTQIRGCRVCEAHLPLGPRPVLQIDPGCKLLIIGQAPGKRVHESGVPWDDASGDRLRDWLGVDDATFYRGGWVGIVPMGFCYPGKGAGGDLPPRPECAPLWHDALRATVPHPGPELTLLVGQYAQTYYLRESRRENLTETVRAWRSYLPDYFPLPHPSPGNFRWFRKNPWFESEVLPFLRKKIESLSP